MCKSTSNKVKSSFTALNKALMLRTESAYGLVSRKKICVFVPHFGRLKFSHSPKSF